MGNFNKFIDSDKQGESLWGSKSPESEAIAGQDLIAPILIGPIVFDDRHNEKETPQREPKLIEPIVFDAEPSEDMPPKAEIVERVEKAPVSGDVGDSPQIVPCALEPEPSQPLVPGKAVGNLFSGYNTFNISVDRSLSVTAHTTEERGSDNFSGFQRKKAITPDSGVLVTSEKPRPYDAAQKVKKIYILRVVGNCLYIFTGKYYQYLPMSKALRLIYSTCEKEVALVGNDSIVRGAYSLLLMDPELCIPQKKPETRYMVFENGVLRLSDGVLFSHTPDLFITTMIKANYDPNNVECPKFDTFLHDLTGGNPELIERFLQMSGYCFTSDTGAKAFFDLEGPSGAGKSTVLEIIQLFFDPEDVTSIELAEMRNLFAASELIGKALCVSPDLADKPLDPFVVGLIKRMTGGDLMTTDRKHQSRAKFYNTAKLIIVRNGNLRVERHDDAFLERIVTMPCHHVVPVEARQKDFVNQLAGEADAIASKAIQAYLRLRANHYRFAGDYYINKMDDAPYNSNVAPVSVESSIRDFMVKNYAQCPEGQEGVVFIEDAYEKFDKLHPGLPVNTFSQHFVELAKTIFQGIKGRKRKPGCKNPQSCVFGMIGREYYDE